MAMQQLSNLVSLGSGHAGLSTGPSPRIRLRGIVASILAGKSLPGAFGDDDTLAEIGIASVDMVTLLLAVEGEFNVEVPTHEITAEVFRSVSTIDALVHRLMPHLAAA
jgi:acyl carrier protein